MGIFLVAVVWFYTSKWLCLHRNVQGKLENATAAWDTKNMSAKLTLNATSQCRTQLRKKAGL